MGTGAYATVSSKKREGSKMNIFEKWIVRRSLKIQRKYDECEETISYSNKLVTARGNELSDNRPMTFNIYRASGGSIVELRKYDHRKDHWDNQLHVIPDDADFNDTLSKIVTLETLRS